MEIYEEVEMVGTENDEMDMFDYAKQIVAAQMEIKAIQEDIKTIKAAAKDKGVLIKDIDTVISDIKRDLKKDPSEEMVQVEIRAKFEANQDLMDAISMTI